MEEKYQMVINGLKQKIELVISKYEKIVSEKRELELELERCREELLNNINKNSVIEEKLDRLQLADAFMGSSSDSREAKQKIEKIIKEIDKCISLLND